MKNGLDLQKRKDVVTVAVVLVIMLLSWFVLANVCQDNGQVLQSLEESKQNVDKITLVSAAAATALAAVPDDSTTPVANQIASIAGNLVMVSVVLTIEKVILKMAPFLCFRGLIPAACVLWLISVARKSRYLRTIAIKLAIFGLCLLLVVPSGVFISEAIQDTIQTKEKLETLFGTAEEVAGEAVLVSTETEEAETAVDSADGTSEAETIKIEEKKGAVQVAKDWISTAWDDVSGWVTRAASDVEEAVVNVVNSVGNLITNAKTLYNIMISTVVAVIISDCVVPVVTFFALLWIGKTIFVLIPANERVRCVSVEQLPAGEEEKER